MTTIQNTTRQLLTATLSCCMTAAYAIDGKLTSADTQDFICKVAPNIGVADSVWSQEKSMSRIRGGDGCPQSWWQRTPFTGEKYTVLACDTVRVVSGSAEAASQDLHAVYSKNAPQQPAQRNGMTGTNARHFSKAELVKGCEPDPVSTRGTALKPVDSGAARLVMADAEHLATVLSLYPQKLDDETLVNLFNTRFKAPADAFERREAIARAAADARAAIKRVPAGAFRIETAINLSPYSFDKNKFEMPHLENDVQEVSYTYNTMSNAPLPSFPLYALSLPNSLKAGYVPTSTDEAKRIERARAAFETKAVVFVQPTKAWMNSGRPVINGIVSRIDVVDAKGKVLFSLAAK